ncbi:hypothetical protein TNCV_2222191 [Trichonephila clavipes]|nr:hypothetical protein TNCV_2222191 [Trichonephila clavipes]
MLNDDEISTSVQADSDPINDETNEDEDNNNERSIKCWCVFCVRDRYGELKTNNNQSIVLLNYCCSRESETLHEKTNGTAKNK